MANKNIINTHTHTFFGSVKYSNFLYEICPQNTTTDICTINRRKYKFRFVYILKINSNQFNISNQLIYKHNVDGFLLIITQNSSNSIN